MPRPLRRLAVTVLGLFVLQVVWVWVVPPFAASDEFDHAFRAAGVVHGDWLPTEQAEHGRGVLVDVSPALVEAASHLCASVPYTEHDNCHPARVNDDGTVAVATAAGNYDPLYYAVVGAASSPVDGSAALYAMRATSLLLCLVVVAVAVAITYSQRAGRWERLGLVVALTPVFVFSSAMAAPNGLEMAAGLLMWTSCLALGSGRRPELTGRYLAAATVAGSLLGVLRMLGPVWLVLILLVAAVVADRDALALIWRTARRPLLLSASVVSAAVVGGAVWVLVADGTTSSDAGSVGRPPHFGGLLLSQSLTWVMQTVAAFPYRDEMAPPVVYPTVLLVVVAGIVLALRQGRRSERAGIATAVVLTVVVPVVLTVLTVDSQGMVWQGRYGLPFVVGVMLQCGRTLDRADWAPVEGARLGALALGMVGAAWVVAVHHVMVKQLGRPDSVVGSGWVHPPLWVVVLATCVGFLALAVAALYPTRTAAPAALPEPRGVGART